tara:strand:+ start:3139 stop:4650 length:1512 start_codon:yes stop_codon:yes gene_type:complete
MSQTKYLEGIEARDAYVRGADKVAKIVKESIGPYGLNLALEKGKMTTNDGFKISQYVSDALKDEFERQGALMQHEASSKTNDKVADATSTTIVLTNEIRKELLKYLPNKIRFVSTKSVAELEKKLDKEREFVLTELKKDTKQIETEQDLINSAKVAVEDEKLAEFIGKTQWGMGVDGRIVPEEVNEDECSIEEVNGILVDNGFASSLMTNNEAEQALDLRDGAIILTNHEITTLEPFKSIITSLVNAKKNNLVIIARAFTQDCVQQLLGLAQTGFIVAPINAPYVNQSQILLDLAAITGAKPIDKDNGSLDELTLDHLGNFSKIFMRIRGGIITGADKREKEIESRIKQLEDSLVGEKSYFAKRQTEERIAQLKGGFALLKIGGYVLDDRKRQKDKADDAVVSVRMAMKGGTVKGGGIAFKEIAEKMEDTSLLKKPLQVIYDYIMSTAPEGFIIEDWVRDPYLTLETALINACESALSFARINGAVVTRHTKPKDTVYEDEEN